MLTRAFEDTSPLGNLYDQQSYEKICHIQLLYNYKYGEIFAPSPALQGIMCVLPGAYSSITISRLLLSGALVPLLSADWKAIKQILEIFKPLDTPRKDYEKKHNFLYLQLLGVDPKYQRQGYAKEMLLNLIERSKHQKLPIYLETQSPKNVEFYQKFGFKVIDSLTLPVIDHQMWIMTYDP